MKKIISVALVLVMCFSLCACGGTGNEAYDYIISLLDKGEYDMAIHVIEGMRDSISTSQQPDQQHEDQGGGAPGEDGDRVFNVEPILNGNDLIFHVDVINDTSFVLTLETMLIIDRANGQELGTCGFEGPDLERIGLGGMVLEPGQGRGYDDGFPAPDAQFNEREYLFVFRDDGTEDVCVVYKRRDGDYGLITPSEE